MSGTSFVLTDPTGIKLKDRQYPKTVLDDAFFRYRVSAQAAATKQAEEIEKDNQAVLLDVCRAFLSHTEKQSAASTYEVRQRYLFDLCFGLPAEYINKDPEEFEKLKAAGKLRRIHAGYGERRVAGLTKLDVSQWCDLHPDWKKGSRRLAIQSIKRCLNWAVEYGFPGVQSNPIKGLKAGKARRRVTYFTPETEAAMLDHAASDFALALKVLIRTGARYDCEYDKLTANEVTNVAPGRQEWYWPDGTKVKGKPRTIRVADPEIIETVNKLCARHPTGPIFRTLRGNPWTSDAMKKRWERMKKALQKKGVEFDPDDCLYSTRHTFAKRVLGGFWNGKPATIELLASLMGNSRQVCWENYAQWCNRYVEPVWEAIA